MPINFRKKARPVDGLYKAPRAYSDTIMLRIRLERITRKNNIEIEIRKRVHTMASRHQGF